MRSADVSPWTAVVFDFDGLILDTETPLYDAWRTTFEHHGAEPIPLDEWLSSLGLHDDDPRRLDPFARLQAVVDRDLDSEEVQQSGPPPARPSSPARGRPFPAARRRRRRQGHCHRCRRPGLLEQPAPGVNQGLLDQADDQDWAIPSPWRAARRSSGSAATWPGAACSTASRPSAARRTVFPPSRRPTPTCGGRRRRAPPLGVPPTGSWCRTPVTGGAVEEHEVDEESSQHPHEGQSTVRSVEEQETRARAQLAHLNRVAPKWQFRNLRRRWGTHAGVALGGFPRGGGEAGRPRPSRARGARPC